MKKIWNELPLPFLSPADAMQYLKNSPYIDSLPPRAKEMIYEFTLTAKPLLQPRGMITSFPVIDNQIDFGNWKYPMPPGQFQYQKISFLVVALANQLEIYIEDLARQNSWQAAMLDALAWEGLMESANYLFEMVLQESLLINLQITKHLSWPEEFIATHQKEIEASMNTNLIEITSQHPRYTFWGAVGWVL